MLIREFLKTYQTTPTCTTSTGLGRKEQEMKESQPFKEHRPAFHDTLEVLHTVQGNDQDFVNRHGGLHVSAVCCSSSPTSSAATQNITPLLHKRTISNPLRRISRDWMR